MEIVTPTSEFDFKSITLADPQPLSGAAGFYFTSLSIGTDTDNTNSKSLCLQLPECVSKQGIVDLKNTKYLDLMFERDTHDELMHWLETLEYTCQDIIDSKKDLWFQTELTRDDIETMMTQIIRLYQSGKYMLMRVFIDVNKGGQKCIAYDENEIGYDIDTLEAGKKIIPLVMIEGVKFSSRSFEISLKLVQVMVMGQTEKKSSCLIKRPTDVLKKEVAVAETRTIKKPAVTSAVAPAVAPAVASAVAPAVAPAPLENQILKARPLLEQSIPAKPLVTKPSTGQPLGVKPLLQQSIATVATKSLATKPSGVQPLATKPSAAKPSAAKPLTVQPVIKPLASKPPLNTQPLEKPVQENIGVLKPIIKKPNTVEFRNNLDKVKNTEKKNDIEEITINYEDVSDSICLKNPNEVYYEMYKNARAKAKQCRINAITAYLEAKQIKTKYMLDDLDDDSDDDSEDGNYNVESD